jgi:hypothetical protein
MNGTDRSSANPWGLCEDVTVSRFRGDNAQVGNMDCTVSYIAALLKDIRKE